MASIKRIGKDRFETPIWEAVYRRTPGGKQIRRRFHLAKRQDVERAILLDTARSGVGLRWSEGVRIYLDAKKAEGKTAGSLLHVERAAAVFIEIMGDAVIEKTTADAMKVFMQAVVERPVEHKYAGKKPRTSGPKVANRHRRLLITVARYLRAHTGKVGDIPFEHVPPLPAKREHRHPIAAGQVNAYLDALPPHVRRPVMMVLYYGLRSTATCNLLPTAADAPYLVAVDKGSIERHIPIDAMLAGILQEAEEFRHAFEKPVNRLFVNAQGRAWDKNTLRRAAQKAWEAAGLERKKIHEVRHTLGTLASKRFPQRMVQAAMGHQDEKSAAAYFHPDEEMAAEVREKIITELSQNPRKTSHAAQNAHTIPYSKSGTYRCPCCGCNLLVSKEKRHKPSRPAAL